MRIVLILLFGVVCAAAGFGTGLWYAPQLKTTPLPGWAKNVVNEVPGAKSLVQSDAESNFETYEYPTIKWKAKPLPDAEGAIAQLSTTYENPRAEGKNGQMKYKLTLFKAPGKQSCEVQLLDRQGFKLMQFAAADFHAIPGAPDIMEARDAVDCPEEQYKNMRDYSIK